MPGSPVLSEGGAVSEVRFCAVEGTASGFGLTSAALLGGAGNWGCEDRVGTSDSDGDPALEG